MKQLHELLNLTRPLFVLDTETTGTDVNNDRIVEIGFEMWTPEGMTKEWRTLVDPGVPIPKEASDVHGITDDAFERCAVCDASPMEHGVNAVIQYGDGLLCDKLSRHPRFVDLAANLTKSFVDCDFAGKNVRFDLRIVAAEMRRARVDWSYAKARVVDNDRLEQLAEPRNLGRMYAKYAPCESCQGKGHNAENGGTCNNCLGTGKHGKPHEGAHGALSDVRASRVVIVGQLEAHPDALPRNLDELHAKQWPGWIDPDGKFKFVNGVACFANWGKYAGKPMRAADAGYWNFILTNDFGSDVKKLASDAKLGKFPEQKQTT